MISLNHVCFSYKKHGSEAISDANASIEPGIHLLLGENGAGKTTLLHLFAGLIKPVSGLLEIDGEKPFQRHPRFLEKVFFLPDDFIVPFKNTSSLVRCHSPFYPRFSAEMLEKNMLSFGLDMKMPFKDMSLGMRHKAYVAYVLALQPDYIFLDEPANGLDIGSKKELRKMMSRCISDEQTVIISTHNVFDLEALYDGVVILSKGNLVLCNRSWEIAESLKFVTSSSPLAFALYQEPDNGLFRGIVPNNTNEESGINYALLYSAILSDRASQIHKLLPQHEH